MKPLILILAMATAGPAWGQTAILPGYWETTNQVTSPFPTKKTERRCIRPEEVARFMNGPSNHIYTCTYPTRQIGGGKIRLAGNCKTRDGKPVPITGEGVFTADTLRLDARIETEFGGLTVPVRARTTARRLGDDCPAAPNAG